MLHLNNDGINDKPEAKNLRATPPPTFRRTEWEYMVKIETLTTPECQQGVQSQGRQSQCSVGKNRGKFSMFKQTKNLNAKQVHNDKQQPPYLLDVSFFHEKSDPKTYILQAWELLFIITHLFGIKILSLEQGLSLSSQVWLHLKVQAQSRRADNYSKMHIILR